MTSVLWRSAVLDSLELCRLVEVPGGHRLAGTVLLPVAGRPVEIRYQVDLDPDWFTRRADVTLTGHAGGGERRLALEGDGDGHWRVDGEDAPALDGCLDVDLECTPATNTLSIRRLGLEAGRTAGVAAAWVRFPELRVERLDQSYERVADSTWVYRAGTFVADLAVDAEGLVLRYGDDFWAAVAHSEPGRLAASARPGALSPRRTPGARCG